MFEFKMTKFIYKLIIKRKISIYTALKTQGEFERCSAMWNVNDLSSYPTTEAC